MGGPLAGYRIIEISGLGPGPFGAMMLADMGAEMIRIERPSAPVWENPAMDLLNRGRRCICVDLKRAEGVEILLRLIDTHDALVEGFRPGVMERLGLGPEVCLERNSRLVYGRMTGWGQAGPLAQSAGHDINYIGLAGALHPIGRRGAPPTPPLSLVGDFGGGGLMLAYGVVCALLERERSGRGQVVDAAMVDGASTLMTIFHATQQLGLNTDERGTHVLDSGSHFYDSYETKDGRWICIGSIEPHFYAQLLEKLGLSPEDFPQMDAERWPGLKDRLAEVFRGKTRDEWCQIFEGTDVCFAPVLTVAESRAHPHARARASHVTIGGVEQPRPAPRLSRTDSGIQRPPASAGEHTAQVLEEAGFSAREVEVLRGDGVVR